MLRTSSQCKYILGWTQLSIVSFTSVSQLYNLTQIIRETEDTQQDRDPIL